jgi:hypothetical protein
MASRQYAIETVGIVGTGAMGRGIAQIAALGDPLGTKTILTILRNLSSVLGDPRYRPSPWLARRAQLGLPLTSADAADSPH